MEQIQYENKLVIKNLGFKLLCKLLNSYFDFNQSLDTMVTNEKYIPKLKIINKIITEGNLDNRKITNDGEILGIYFEIIKSVLNDSRDRFYDLCLSFLQNPQYPNDTTADIFKRLTKLVEEMCIIHKEDKRLIYCEPDDDSVTLLYKKTLDGLEIKLVS
jgi:hypothetical protein